MAKEKILYWLGTLVGTRRVGSIKAGGKLYAIGEPFPADKVDAKRLAVFKKAGCVASVPFPVADSGPVGDDMALLQGRLSDAVAQAKADGDTIAGLELELELEAASGGDVAALKIRVAELEPECKRLTDDNEEKAALIDQQKVEIKALNKTIKDGKK